MDDTQWFTMKLKGAIQAHTHREQRKGKENKNEINALMQVHEPGQASNTIVGPIIVIHRRPIHFLKVPEQER